MQISSSMTSANQYENRSTKSYATGSFAGLVEFRLDMMHDDASSDTQVMGSKATGSFSAFIENELAGGASAKQIAFEMNSRFRDLVAAGKNGDDEIFTAEVAGTLLGSANSQVINPVDRLTDSDVRLFHDTTGLYLYNGDVLDENGNISDDVGAGQLLCAVYELREHGVTGSDGYIHSISGAITAADLAKLIEPYRLSANEQYSSGTLDKAIEILTAQEASARHETVTG